MDDLADRIEGAADTLAAAGRRLLALTVAATAFGADDAGLPGRLGRELHAHWAAVLDARGREAAAAAHRMSEMAGSIRVTQRRYRETDELVSDRFEREGR